MSSTKERIDKMQEAYDRQSPPGDYTKISSIADEIEASIIDGYFDDTTQVLAILRDFFNQAVRDELPSDIEKDLTNVITDSLRLPSFAKHKITSRLIRYAIRQTAIQEAKCRI